LVGKASAHPAVASIIKTSELVTEASIKAAQANLSIREIGKAAADTAFSIPEQVSGFGLRPGTVIVCGGHGINTVFHDSPYIPSFDDGNDDLIPVGTFFTIEPHISLWSSAYTVDKIEGSDISIIKVGTKFNAATEHTCVMTDSGLVVLTR
jgi:methionine aminopeptidase